MERNLPGCEAGADRPVLGLGLAVLAQAHDHYASGWAPWTSGPRLGLPATEVLRQLPIAGSGNLDLETAPRFTLVPQEIERLAGGPTQGRTTRHGAGGRRLADATGTRADTDVQAAEPYIWVDERTDRLRDADLTTPNCATISVSDDGGDTFSAVPNCHHTDHQTLFAGPPPPGTPAPTGHPHVAYYCSNDGGATVESLGTGCSKSRDGGTTWVRTGDLAFRNDPSRTGGSLGIPGFCSGATGQCASGS